MTDDAIDAEFHRLMHRAITTQDLTKDEVTALAHISMHRVTRAEQKYQQLVDVLCSPAWARRTNHDDVIKLAARMKARELTIVAMTEKEKDI